MKHLNLIVTLKVSNKEGRHAKHPRDSIKALAVKNSQLLNLQPWRVEFRSWFERNTRCIATPGLCFLIVPFFLSQRDKG